MCAELNLKVIVEHIHDKASGIKEDFKKKDKNIQKLDIFDIESVKANLPSYTTEIKFFRLSEVYEMCSASDRILLEAKRNNNHDVFLRIESILKEIQSGEVRIPIFIKTSKGLNIVDGIHRIYSLYHIFKEEDPEMPILLIKKRFRSKDA